jgi:hypothetical protein
VEWLTETIEKLRSKRDNLNRAIAVLMQIVEDGGGDQAGPVTALEVVAAAESEETRGRKIKRGLKRLVREIKEKPTGKKREKKAPALKKSAKTIYNVCQHQVVAALEAAGEPLSTHSLKEHLLVLNIKPSDEHLKKLLALVQSRGVIALGDDGNWHVSPGGGE